MNIYRKRITWYSYSPPSGQAPRCLATKPNFTSTWSISVYGNDGFMKSENNIVNSPNAKLNADGTFTVYFGSVETCGQTREVNRSLPHRRRIRSVSVPGAGFRRAGLRNRPVPTIISIMLRVGPFC